MWDFINSFIINFALVLSSILTTHFITIRSIIKKSAASNFIYKQSFTVNYRIFTGVFLGLTSFMLSINSIPLWDGYYIDMRYIFIFFAILYGNVLTGLITSGVLILTTYIQYFTPYGQGFAYYLNHLALIAVVLSVAILITRQKWTPLKSTLVFLVAFIFTRLIFFIEKHSSSILM